jgi:hypothetical protein
MRLSVHVAAKISALCEMFPQTALDDLERGLEDTHPWEESEEGLENLPTQKTNYQALVRKYLEEIEASDRGAAVEVTPTGRRRAGK